MSIKSMTGFARQRCEWAAERGDVYWELRSVNHRFLDINLRLPEAWHGLDNQVRRLIATYVQRGKIDCNLHDRQQMSQSHQQLNTEALTHCLQHIKTIEHLAKQQQLTLAPVSATDLLQVEGVLQAEDIDSAETSPILLAALEKGLKQLSRQRLQEGDQLKQFIQQRCHIITSHVQQIQQDLPLIIDTQRQRLEARLTTLATQPDEDRLAQEVVIWIQKLDITEELDRINAHLAATELALQEDNPVGRRLDFLMQELNREANTLASKSQHQSTSQAGIDIKVLIEQMREQVQNIE